MRQPANVLRGVSARTSAATVRAGISIVFGVVLVAFALIALVNLVLLEPIDSVPAVLTTIFILGLGLMNIAIPAVLLRRLTGLDVRVDERGISLSDGRTWPWSDIERVRLGTRHGAVVDRLAVRFTARPHRRTVMVTACPEATTRALLERCRPGITAS